MISNLASVIQRCSSGLFEKKYKTVPEIIPQSLYENSFCFHYMFEMTMSVVTILHHPQVRTSLLPWYQNLRVSLKNIAAASLTGVKNEKLNTHQISPGFSPRRLHENIDNFHRTIIFNYRQHWLQQECGVLKFYSYGRIPELEPHEDNDGQSALSVPVAEGTSDFRFERHVQSEHNP
jgi:hypothetical protein